MPQILVKIQILKFCISIKCPGDVTWGSKVVTIVLHRFVRSEKSADAQSLLPTLKMGISFRRGVRYPDTNQLD